MKRREFLIGGAAAAWPIAARAQPARKLPTIGYLGSGTLTTQTQWVAAFVQRLRELGRIEGRTISVEYRWTEGRRERSVEFVAEFIRNKVDMIVTSGAANVVIAKQATATIPIVFAVTADPVGTGLVASLARPGGNVTGLSGQSTDYAGKQVQLLREVVPGFSRLAIIANADSPGAMSELSAVQTAARALKIEATAFELGRAEEIASIFETLKGGTDALYVVPDPLVSTNRIRIITLALGARVPAIYASRDYVEAGGLMSYGANIPDLFRRAGDHVDKILRGVKPADIPVEQPTKFDLVINLSTAKALGLTVPPTLLARADEVIE